MTLSLPSFDAFYHWLTGYTPFPWQTALRQQFSPESRPRVLAIPTGTGKSSIVAIWFHALAEALLQDDRIPRTVPLRLIYVVDRRLIVDSVEDQAQELARRLIGALQDPDDLMHAVAQTMTSSLHDRPLLVQRARGGVRVPRLWVPHPTQPAVFVSTVDQAGSRLLFRGYGVSAKGRSIQAGLFGIDTLWVVDESHLSQAFVKTLRSIQNVAASFSALPALQVLEMTATPPDIPDHSFFQLTAHDWGHPILRPRLTAPRWVTLVGDPNDQWDSKKMVSSAVKAVLGISQHHASGVGLVVLNTVSQARAVAEELRKEAQSPSHVHAVTLLTGRMRPIDRARILAAWTPKVAASRARNTTDSGISWVISTQTVEVGADWDFDYLISECAPLPALLQRLGRLNRLGSHAETTATIIASPKTKSVYDLTALTATWEWLTTHTAANGRMDLSPAALDALGVTTVLPTLSSPTPAAPHVLAPHVTAWAQTHPSVVQDPDVSPFLHGIVTRLPDVHILWRADLTTALLERATQDDIVAEQLQNYLTWIPPLEAETLDLPIWWVRQWLGQSSGQSLPLLTDVFDPNWDLKELSDPQWKTSPTLWRVDDHQAIDLRQLRPGDTVIVPAEYGGCDAWGWNPHSKTSATDVFDAAQQAESRQTLRFVPALLKIWGLSSTDNAIPCPSPDHTNDEDLVAITEWLEAIASHDSSDLQPQFAAALDACRHQKAKISAAPDIIGGFLLHWTNTVRPDQALPVPNDTEQDDTDDINQGIANDSVLLPSLVDHQAAVQRFVETYAEQLHLPDRLHDLLSAAAAWHDLGKIDPRFQTFLHAGDYTQAAIAIQSQKWAAKSAMDPQDRQQYYTARQAAAYPRGLRHEELSVRLVDSARHYGIFGTETWTADEWALVRHLIGTHHGWGRPWFPSVSDPHPISVDVTYQNLVCKAHTTPELHHLNARWIDQFVQLNQHWGYWGLAYLEALVRLADYAASAICEKPNRRDTP